MIKILPIGGRVKAASIGLDRFFADTNGVGLDKTIAGLRRKPCDHLRKAFFPRTGNELRHMTSGIGLYRPVLKTDQGMPGNFLPFTIDTDLERTDLSVRSIGTEEGVVIPEAWHTESNGLGREIQAAFLQFDLDRTFEMLQQLDGRRAEKGRLPFMFIRPALPERPIVFGRDILKQVEYLVQCLLITLEARAQVLETTRTGEPSHPANLIWAQPDVFVLTDGTIAVEKINCPDVGFFLAGLEAEGSHVLPQVQAIMSDMLDAIADRIIEKMGPRITIVTRDAVLSQQEDVLEIREIEILQRALAKRGAEIAVIPVSAVNSVETGTRLLLLNLDYKAEGIATLLWRHAADEVECFPNPYIQMVSAEGTGLQEVVMNRTDKHCKLFLERTSSQPGTDAGIAEALRLIDKSLNFAGITSDILHVGLETETVPVLRSGLHSWRQFTTRAQRPANENGAIRLRAIPARPDNLLLTSSTGPRLHAFRFMCVA